MRSDMAEKIAFGMATVPRQQHALNICSSSLEITSAKLGDLVIGFHDTGIHFHVMLNRIFGIRGSWMMG